MKAHTNSIENRAQSSLTLSARLGVLMLLLFAGLSQAAEVQMGSGAFSVKGGLLSLESATESSASVLTVKEQHSNLLTTDLFYNYSLSTYRSGRWSNQSNTITTLGGGQLQLPVTGYDWQGIDAQVTLGYDLIKKSASDYFGVGLSLGVATPYIDNTGANDLNLATDTTLLPSGSSQAVDLFASRTEFSGQKLGPKILFGKSLNRMASVYGEVSYAWQNMQVKNSDLDFSTEVDGDYFSYELGMKYQPFSSKQEFGFITLEPSLYFTLGVNYSQLTMDDLKVDLSGQQYKLDSGKMDMTTTTLNFGIGYSF